MGAIEEIKKSIKEGNAVIGTNEVIDGLKKSKLAKVYVTSNCPEDIKKDVNYYADFSNADVVNLREKNDELGMICKKPFSISLFGVNKGA
ncbi:50S ribosomal protein L30 [Candidatus Woesearchaeota archaeon]|nr:50S ribosomal protein L30 [Candidatus Woesearchaeota archaeon]